MEEEKTINLRFVDEHDRYTNKIEVDLNINPELTNAINNLAEAIRSQ